MSMKTELSGLVLDNPIIGASGCFGFGYEFSKFYDINILGSFCLKAATIEDRYGNDLPRVAEVKGGMLNAIGLENPGANAIVKEHLPLLADCYKKKAIANIAGKTIDEYVECAKILDQCDEIGILEINVSCPNVKKGAMAFGSDKVVLKELIEKLKATCTKPIYIKLSPNVTDIVDIAKACENYGADGLVLINTLVGTRIDIKTRKFILANKVGGLSGSAIFSVALRMVYQVSQAVSIPIIGCGGITCAKDVIEMMLAGASAVQVGTQNLIDPYACKKIIEDLRELMKELNILDLKNIIGGVSK